MSIISSSPTVRVTAEVLCAHLMRTTWRRPHKVRCLTKHGPCDKHGRASAPHSAYTLCLRAASSDLIIELIVLALLDDHGLHLCHAVDQLLQQLGGEARHGVRRTLHPAHEVHRRLEHRERLGRAELLGEFALGPQPAQLLARELMRELGQRQGGAAQRVGVGLQLLRHTTLRHLRGGGAEAAIAEDVGDGLGEQLE